MTNWRYPIQSKTYRPVECLSLSNLLEQVTCSIRKGHRAVNKSTPWEKRGFRVSVFKGQKLISKGAACLSTNGPPCHITMILFSSLSSFHSPNPFLPNVRIRQKPAFISAVDKHRSFSPTQTQLRSEHFQQQRAGAGCSATASALKTANS